MDHLTPTHSFACLCSSFAKSQTKQSNKCVKLDRRRERAREREQRQERGTINNPSSVPDSILFGQAAKQQQLQLNYVEMSR